MIKSFIFLLVCLFLLVGCSFSNNPEKKDIDLFTEDNTKTTSKLPFNVRKQEIIFNKSKYIKNKERQEKIDLGSL